MKHLRIGTKLLFTALLLFILAAAASAIELKTGIGTVTAGGLRLRATASTDGEILANADLYDKVVIIREVNGWYLVDYNLQIGYMSADYLEFDPVKNIELGYGRASECSVNLRASPSPDGELIRAIPLGEKAYIIGFNNCWYKVQYDGSVGYIRSDLLELTEKPVGNGGGSLGANVVAFAKEYLGTPYVWGGTKPSGFDCSGFTRYVANNFGVYIGRTADDQLDYGYAVDSLSPGDLVFFERTYGSGARATHVGIYAGDGYFVHAANGGVKVTALSDDYYASRYIGARRIF